MGQLPEGHAELPMATPFQGPHPSEDASSASQSQSKRSGGPVPERLGSLKTRLAHTYVDWQDLEEVAVVGRGSFAIVSKCIFTPQHGRPQVVAMKQIKTELLQDPSEVAAFIAEVRLLSKIDYRYIVKLYGCGWSRLTEEEEEQSAHGRPPPAQHHLFFIQEYMEGGTAHAMVLQAMSSTQGSQVYSDADALRWSLQIALALEYLHSQRPKIIHRDLKLENILLSRRRPALASAKLSDFGLARRLQGATERAKKRAGRLTRAASSKRQDLDAYSRELSDSLEARLEAWMAKPLEDLEDRSYHAAHMTAPAGSLGYMAPEVLRGEPYNEMADVFSFGVILYNLLHRNIPSYHILLNGSFADLEAYAHRVAHGFRQRLRSDLEPRLGSLIERCWQADPRLRPGMAEVAQELAAMQPPLPDDDDTEPAKDKETVECTRCSLM